MKKFQIVIESGAGKGAIIDSTDSKKKVDKWLADFKTAGAIGQTFKIFQLSEEIEGAYILVHQTEKSEPIPDVRPIGFGRW